MSLWLPVVNASVWLIAGRALSLIAGFVSIAAISRSLGPAEFGQLSYVLAIVAIVAPLGQFGLNAIVVKDLVKSPAETAGILGSTLVVRIGATLLSLAIALFLVATLRPEEDDFQWYVLILMLAEVARTWVVCSFAFEARNEFSLIAIVNAVIAISFAVIKTVLAGYGVGLDTFVVIFAAETAISGPIFFLLYRNRIRTAPFSASIARIGDLTMRSRYLAISGVLAIANLKVDQIMLGNLSGDSAVGLYAIAARVSELWFFLPQMIATAAFPVLVKLNEENQPSFRAMFQNALDLLGSLAFVFILAMTFFAQSLVLLVFGTGYEAAAPLIVVHMWSGLFFAIRAMASKWLVLKDLYWMSLVSHGLGAAGNVLLNFFLIPAYGAMGAAIATVISYALSGYVVFFLFRRTRPAAYAMTLAILVPLRLPAILRRALRNRTGHRLT